MQTGVVKLFGATPDVSKIKEAAAVVDAGGLVAFPTETVYGIACRVRTDSLRRLNELKGREAGKPYTLHISRLSEVERYVPVIGMRAQKLIERAWPGPLTIVFELDAEGICRQRDRLDAEVFEHLYKGNSVGIRCPDDPVASMLLEQTRHAVVAPSANISGHQPAVNAEEVLAQLGGRIELLLDSGPCRYKKNSTVVKTGVKGLEILRQGVYSKEELEAISAVRFLFVCTGNTCRSPMAEGMFGKYLAEKLELRVDQLDAAGYKVGSAGIIDTKGFAASAEAISACAARGVDIKAHKSRTLTEKLVRESDLIFAMCNMHWERVIALGGEAGNKCMLLAENKDIPDPVGQPQGFYESCADVIEEAVKKRINELVI